MESLTLATRVMASESDVVVLDVEGTLDINTVTAFEDKLQELVLSGKSKIVISMRKLTYISSSGISVLMYYISKTRKNHGSIILTDVSHEIYRIFELLDIQGLFKILSTKQDAINKFNGNNISLPRTLSPVC